MNKKILCLSILFALSGCESTKSFHIPIFEDVIEYKEDVIKNDNLYDEKKEKEFMYNVMIGQLELNEGNTRRAIENYEKSLSEKQNEVAYTLLEIYYKENDYENSKRVAKIISDKNIKSDSIGNQLLVSLLNNNYINSSEKINSILSKIDNVDIKQVSYLEAQVKKYKEISDMIFFSNNDISKFNENVEHDNFVLLKFFYLYNLSNSKGEDPDEPIKYLKENLNKDNLLHNFTLFRIAYIEHYHVNVYKNEMIYLTEVLNNYVFDINTLEKLYTNDINLYEELKERMNVKYSNDISYWYFLSVIEDKASPKKSLQYLNNAYNIIEKKQSMHELKDKIIGSLILKNVNNQNYDVSKYINKLSDNKQKEIYFKQVMYIAIFNNNYNDDLLEKYKHIVSDLDRYLTISRIYTYFEDYNKAMTYLEHADELSVSNNIINLDKIMILSKINPKIAVNEAEIFLEKENTPESRLVLLYAKLNNNENLKEGREEVRSIYYKYDKKTISEQYYQFTTYLFSRYNYEIGKYERSKETLEQLEIGSNYIYLADYGKILWKLNQKTKAKKMFKKSKEIFDSKYLSNIIKELNIKNLE